MLLKFILEFDIKKRANINKIIKLLLNYIN